MKQIEHDSQFSYAEMQLFRETVFQHYTKELEAQRPFDPEDSIEVFELVSPDSEPGKSNSPVPSSNSQSADDDAKNQTKRSEIQSISPLSSIFSYGLYGWLTSWFGGTPAEIDSNDDEDQNRAALLDMWPSTGRRLPPNLKKIEKNIEAEILNVLSESWDDSTILRRDTLFAELVLQLDKMIIRFVDDEELFSSGRSRVLALDMNQLASRILLSPREHRTEVMLSVGEMSVQRLRIVPIEPSRGVNLSLYFQACKHSDYSQSKKAIRSIT